MKNENVERLAYRAPLLREYGDIRKLTAATEGNPGAIDSLYYLAQFNNLDGCVEQSFS